MKTLQRLDDYNSLRKEPVSNITVSLPDLEENATWYLEGGTLAYSGDNFYVSTHYVINVPAVDGSGVTPIVVSLDVDSIFEEDDINGNFVFSGVIFCELANITVNTKLYDANGISIEPIEGKTKQIQAGTWGAIRSNILNLKSITGTAHRLDITITAYEGHPIRISTPNIVNDDVWAANPVIQSMRPYIPDFYSEYDAREQDPTFPFFRFTDVLTNTIADTMFTYSEWYQFDTQDIIQGDSKADLSTRSRLTNYKAVYEENVEWLAQFSGNKLKKQLYVSDQPVVPTLNLPAFREWQLFPAGYGRNAGTQGSIKQAARFVLSGTKSVIIGQHVDGNPWKIRVTTLASETPGVDIRASVKLATTASLDISTDLQAGDLIDGIPLVAGDRVLVKNQSTASENGIYVAVASGAASRAADFDTSGEVVKGATFIASQGFVNGKNAFELTTSGTITLGSTGLTFSPFAGSPKVLAVVEPARPLGYSLIHEIATEFTFVLGDPEFGKLGTSVL